MYHVTITPLTRWQMFKKYAMSYTGIMTWISAVALIWAFLYKYLFVNIPAKWEFMPVLGEITFAVVLSIVASTIVLIVTIYIPERQKQKKVIAIVMPWLKQYMLLGDTILQEIAGSSNVSREEFQARCVQDCMSPVQSQRLLFVAGGGFPNWFQFFEFIFAQEEVYYTRLLPYLNMLPLEVLNDMESLLMPDGLRNAMGTYKTFYGNRSINVDYNHLTNLEHLIWQDAQIMKGMAEKCQLYA